MGAEAETGLAGGTDCTIGDAIGPFEIAVVVAGACIGAGAGDGEGPGPGTDAGAGVEGLAAD